MFCRVCGNRLHEEAVVCPSCGCAVESVSKKVKNSDNNVKNGGFFIFLNYLNVALICLALTFFALSIIYANVYSDFFNVKIYGNIIQGHINSNFSLYGDSIDLSFMFSLVALIGAIVNFILGFKKKNKNKSFISHVIFIISICLFIVSCSMYF